MQAEDFKAAFKAELAELIAAAKGAAWAAEQVAKSIDHNNVDEYHLAAVERSLSDATRLSGEIRALIQQFKAEIPGSDGGGGHPFARRRETASHQGP